MTALLDVKNLTKYYPIREGFLWSRRARYVHAVDGVSFSIDQGDSLGLVGESGCGKTTVARLIARLIDPTRGSIHFAGIDLLSLDRNRLRSQRRELQIVFQDPFASLNPRKTVYQILSRPFRLHTEKSWDEITDGVVRLLEEVGLVPAERFMNRYPHEFSGGQRQRVGIARAIALRPKLVVADEPVSSLDVSVRAQVLNLLKDLRRELGLTYLFISHDLAVVRSTCTRVAVMYLGRIVEVADSEDLFESPQHPYTRALMSCTLVPNPRVLQTRQPIVLQGDVPNAIDLPSGCRFYSRCPQQRAGCDVREPELTPVRSGHEVACWCS